MAKLEKVIRELMLKNRVLSRVMNEFIDSAVTRKPVPVVDKYLLKGFRPAEVKNRRTVNIEKAKRFRCKGYYDKVVEVKQLEQKGQFYFNCLFVDHHNEPHRIEIWDVSAGAVSCERTRITNLRTNKKYEKLIKGFTFTDDRNTVTGWIPVFLGRESWPVVEKAFRVLEKMEAK